MLLSDLQDAIKQPITHVLGVPEAMGEWLESLLSEIRAENLLDLEKRDIQVHRSIQNY